MFVSAGSSDGCVMSAAGDIRNVDRKQRRDMLMSVTLVRHIRLHKYHNTFVSHTYYSLFTVGS